MHYILGEIWHHKGKTYGADDVKDLACIAVYPTLEALIFEIEAPHVIENSYRVFDSEGYEIELYAAGEFEEIVSRGRTGFQDLETVNSLVRQGIEVSREVHPDCVDLAKEQIKQLSGTDLTAYKLQISARIRAKIKENSLRNRIRKFFARLGSKDK